MKNTYSALVTDDRIVIVSSEGSVSVPRTAPQARLLVEALRKGTASVSELLELAQPKQAVKAFSDGRASVVDGQVLLDGRPVPPVIERKLGALMRDGQPFDYLVKFLDRLGANPSNRATEELYRFLEHEGLPITPQGTFLAYKGVGPDMYSVKGNTNTRVRQGTVDSAGRIYNGLGCTVEVDRRDVDDTCTRTCSHGLHVGSYDYASNWGPVVVLVEVDPADVVSIPIDCDGQKARVCKYRVVGSCTGKMRDSAVSNADNAYATPVVTDDDDNEFRFTEEDLEMVRDEGYADGYAEGLKASRKAIENL